MKKLLLFFNKLLFPVTILLLILSVFRLFQHRWIHYFAVPEAVKDEVGFQAAFHAMLQDGWYQSVASGVSLSYNLFAFPLYLITGDELLSLRLINLLAMMGLVLIWFVVLKKTLNPRTSLSILLFLFMLNIGCRSIAYFSATSDAIFIFFLTLSIVSFFAIKSNPKYLWTYIIISGISLALALSARELLFFYLPGLLILFLFFIWLKKISLKHLLITLFISTLTILILHYPSLKEHQTISVHDKDFKRINVTWAEMNYLSLIENKEKLIYGRNTKNNPITPERVLEYRKIYGDNALPNTYFKAIIKDPVFTFKNFIGLLYLSQLPFILQQGIFYFIFTLFPVFLIFHYYRKRQNIEWHNFLPFIFFILFTCSLCITPIRHIEFRHFMFFTFFVSAFGIINLFRINLNKYYQYVILYFNLIFIAIPNIFLWGIW